MSDFDWSSIVYAAVNVGLGVVVVWCFVGIAVLYSAAFIPVVIVL